MQSIDGMINVMLGDSTIHTTTLFVEPKWIVRVTRQGKPDRRDRRATFLVTEGVPNCDAQKFIKQAQRAGEPFPIKKLQYRFYPVLKKAA